MQRNCLESFVDCEIFHQTQKNFVSDIPGK